MTNIVIFDVAGTGNSADQIVRLLDEKGVRAIGFGSLIRMVTHRDVSADDIEATLSAMADICR